jgi:hypothetical protein
VQGGMSVDDTNFPPSAKKAIERGRRVWNM